MANSAGLGFMAAFAVSGSVVLIARQLHKRLLSDFMKQIESELGGSKRYQAKKRVRFAEDVMEPSSNNKEYRKRQTVRVTQGGHRDHSHHDRDRDHERQEIGTMPLNRQILYKGIIESRCLIGYDL